MSEEPEVPTSPAVEKRGWEVIGALTLGYVAIYLCRKNLSVAMPMLQEQFHASKAQVGTVASVGTLAYAIGKFTNGPIVDSIGGRRGFLGSIVLVAVFGALGAISPGLTLLSAFYGLNRFAGAAGWGGMLKLVPSWFSPKRSGTVVGVLSLSYVLGGVIATLCARQVVAAGGSWRAVMGVPSLLAIVIAGICAIFVRVGPLAQSVATTKDAQTEKTTIESGPAESKIAQILGLFRMPQFLVTCALSFTLTLMRESFNTWSVDFLLQAQGGKPSLATASLQSIGFDLAGFVSILLAGVAYDRVRPSRRRWLMFISLALLSGLLLALPATARANPLGGAVLVALVGLLVYGPYSLLAGALAVVNGGAKLAATAAGIIDGVGYIAGALAGITLGRLLDTGGYDLGFQVLAVITAVSAFIALGLR